MAALMLSIARDPARSFWYFQLFLTLTAGGVADAGEEGDVCREREFFIDNLLVRIRLIVEMVLEDWPCAMGV